MTPVLRLFLPIDSSILANFFLCLNPLLSENVRFRLFSLYILFLESKIPCPLRLDIYICFQYIEGIAWTKILFQKIPLTMSLPARQICPLPCWCPFFHQPLQKLLSVQNISPQPYFLSCTKLPLQKFPLGKYNSPQPSFNPSLQPPLYLVSPLCHLPLPCLSPFLKLPSQKAPSAFHSYPPMPSNLPFWYSPLYTSPFAKTSSPSPCLSQLTNMPVQVDDLVLRVPLPCMMPSFHVPSQMLDYISIQSPMSWRRPSRK